MSQFDSYYPWKGMKRVILNPDGTVAYELDPNNSNYKADGTEVDWQEVESLGQNCMVQIPKFWYIKKTAGDIVTFGVSDRPKDGWKVHPAFFRQRDRLCDVINNDVVPEVEYRYIGAFHGWIDESGRLRSLPHKSPTTRITIGDARNAAKKNGNGYGILDYYLLYAIQMLYITEYGHPDAQTMIGRGFVDDNSGKTQTGATLNKGNHTFGEAAGNVQMSYRGIEDWWGNVANWLDGLYIGSGYGGRILVSNKGFNNTGSGYEQISSGTVSGGNIRTIKPEEKAGFLPETTNGADYESGGLYDYGVINLSSLAAVGAYCSGGSNSGPFRIFGNYAASSLGDDVGARVCF